MEGVGLAASIITIVQILQKAYESQKDAPESLQVILAQANSLAALIKRVDSIEPLLSDDRRRFLDSQFNRKSCESTVQDLKSLVDKINPNQHGLEKADHKKGLSGQLGLKPRIMWFLKESNARRLSERMKTQCEHIAAATDQILLECGLFMERQLVELREAILNKSKPVITAAEQTPQEGLGSQNSPSLSTTHSSNLTETTHDVPLWLGQYRLKQGQTRDMAYFNDREVLSKSAKYGDWDEVLRNHFGFPTLGNGQYQNWINSTRILNTEDKREPSGFTLLHQAAWHGASTAVVDKLIRRGAWRLSRTVRPQGNDRLKTPLDVAKEFGWAHLYPLLTPVIQHTVPAIVLVGLQVQLNRIFFDEFPSGVDYFHPPQVEILTELKYPQLWSPLDAENEKVAKSAGLHLFLDGRELVARFIKAGGSTSVYRIHENGADEIERGVMLDFPL